MPTPIRPIRLTKSWRWYAPGHVFEAMAPGMAKDMVANNWAEYIGEPQRYGYIHTMMEVAPKRKRGRPRKER